MELRRRLEGERQSEEHLRAAGRAMDEADGASGWGHGGLSSCGAAAQVSGAALAEAATPAGGPAVRRAGGVAGP